MNKLLLLFFLLVGLYSNSTIAQNIKFENAPEWVEDIHPDIHSKFSKYDISSGFYYSIYDIQSNLKTQEDFSHYVVNVVSNAGVSLASEIQIAYDTAYQTLNFHYLYVWRKGKKIDRTSQLTLEELNNENNLQSGIYSGTITAYDILEDIRVGDKIEFAYTIKGYNPIYADNNCGFYPLVSNNPIDFYSLRILSDKDSDINYKCEECKGVEVKDLKSKNYKIIQLVVENVESYKYEETTAVGYLPYAYFVFSTSKSWEEVVDWALDVFHLEEEQDLDEVYEEIFSGKESQEEKMTAILDYVQNEIRYMGIESGIGSIKPFPPMQVVKQRFGDCKDKSLLVCELFKKLGIETCYPALVNSSLAQGIEKLKPGAQFFDHCIVYYEYQGKSHWLDPTVIQQGGDYKSRQIVDYGKALVIKEGEKELKPMIIENVNSSTYVREEFIINAFSEPAKLKVVSELKGGNADVFRSIMEYYSKKDMSDYLKSVYTPLFHSISVTEDLKIKDNLEENIITLIENYKIDNLWRTQVVEGQKQRFFQYEPLGLYNYFPPVDCETKKNPVYNVFPAEYNLEVSIALPDRIRMEKQIVDEDNVAYHFDKNIRLKSQNLVLLDYTFKSKTKEISPLQFEEICPKYSLISNDLPILFTFPILD